MIIDGKYYQTGKNVRLVIYKTKSPWYNIVTKLVKNNTVVLEYHCPVQIYKDYYGYGGVKPL